jgi:hypothetical protein
MQWNCGRKRTMGSGPKIWRASIRVHGRVSEFAKEKFSKTEKESAERKNPIFSTMKKLVYETGSISPSG